MKNTVMALQKIIPKEIDVLKRRYNLLTGIQSFQPIGRRSLSNKLNMSEKIIRTDTEYLKAEGYILVTSTGMELTESGNILLEELKDFIRHLKGISSIEDKVKDILNCSELYIVPGDADSDEQAKKNIGKTTSKLVLNYISNSPIGSIVAITGGSTVCSVINELKPKDLKYKDLLVVPARGSLGNKVKYHANTLVYMLAEKINCKYRLLNIPDNLSRNALLSVSQEPDIQKTIAYILKANVIIFGIGNASEMAKRRNLDEYSIRHLIEKKAVAEVLGYYVDKHGDIVYTSRSIGITIDKMTNLNYPVAVAGGSKKAEAILAVKEFVSKGCLVIDEGAALKIIELSQQA